MRPINDNVSPTFTSTTAAATNDFAATSSYEDVANGSVPPNSPTDYHPMPPGCSGGGGDYFLPPPYQAVADSHFLFPSFGSGVGLPPLTPITPSVDPALGFKNGYIVPQTPNNMSVAQFFQVVQVIPKRMVIG